MVKYRILTHLTWVGSRYNWIYLLMFHKELVMGGGGVLLAKGLYAELEERGGGRDSLGLTTNM